MIGPSRFSGKILAYVSGVIMWRRTSGARSSAAKVRFAAT